MKSPTSCFAVGTLTLCLIVTLAPAVSAQSCPSGKASSGSDGVGNNDAKASLAAPSAGCDDYVASLGVATAHENQLGGTAVVRVAFECADGTVDETEAIAYDSDYETQNVPAPASGFNSLSGTYDGTGITSIEGVGKTSGTHWTFTCAAGEVVTTLTFIGQDECGVEALDFYCSPGFTRGTWSTSSTSSGCGTGCKAGAAIGVIAAVVIIALLIVYLVFRRRRTTATGPRAGGAGLNGADAGYPKTSQAVPGVPMNDYQTAKPPPTYPAQTTYPSATYPPTSSAYDAAKEPRSWGGDTGTQATGADTGSSGVVPLSTYAVTPTEAAPPTGSGAKRLSDFM